LPDSNQALQAFIINTRRTIRVDTTMAAQPDALLQQMQDQIDALQINLAASAAATLAATKAAAAATTALAGLPPTGTPNLGTAAPIFALSPAMHLQTSFWHCNMLLRNYDIDMTFFSQNF
jgi:hypothetical protein